MYMSCFSKNVSSKNTLQKSEVNIKHYWAGPDVSKKEKQERKKARDSRFIQFSREDNSRENLMVGSRSWCCITTNVLSHIFQDVNGTVWAIVQWVDWSGIASRIVFILSFPYHCIFSTGECFVLASHLLPNTLVRLVRCVYSHIKMWKN